MLLVSLFFILTILFSGLVAINHYTKFFNICLCLVAFSHNLKFLGSIAHEHTLKVWISLSLSLIICLYNDVRPIENSVNIIIVGASNGCVLHVVWMLTVIKSMRYFFYWQLMIGAFSWVNILGGTRSVSWDYLKALVKRVAFPSLFNLLPSLCSCFLFLKN